MKKTLFSLVFILGLFFRFFNLNWDNNYHLHPDERFLTMVSTSMRFSSNFLDYFDQKKSQLNPYNLGFNFYVYGTWPLILNKSLANIINLDNYNDLTILGRFLSAAFDFLTIIFVYKIAKLLFPKKKNLPLISAFFYAIAVYPIQSAHFFTTDTFLNFFMTGALYFALKTTKKRFFKNILFSAIFFGFALASKISALYILPLILLVIFIKIVYYKDSFLNIVFFFIFSYLTLRLTNPYYFQSASFLNFKLHPLFVQSTKSLIELSRLDVWYPPAVQWLNKPVYALLLTTGLVGVGPIYFIFLMSGLFFFLSELIANKMNLLKKNKFALLVFSWVVLIFIYQSLSFVKSIRYTAYLYPYFAILSALGIYTALKILKNYVSPSTFQVFCYTLYIILLVWPFLFITIYSQSHTRVLASKWIYQNVDSGKVILGEHWDDPLPLPMVGYQGKIYQIDILPIFDPDTKEKWLKIKDLLNKGDYYVLSSNRGWGSIPTVPKRYPLMSWYYQALLSNNCQKQKELVGVCYQKIKTFEPYYYQFIRYPDSWIEETFTVYDHPTVIIYKKR